MRRARIAVASALLILVVHGRSELPGCGPFFPAAVFSFERYPLPAPDYAAGKLGVVEPTFWRKFLFTAYRYFADAPLTDAERAAVAGESARPAATTPEKLWLEALAKVEGVARKDEPDVYRRVPGDQYEQYLNCAPDAFRTAAATLEARSRELGSRHPALRKWIAAQDVVFSNCGGGGAMPAPAETDLPPLLRHDREYQIAAAHFYAENFREAEARFRAIAADRTSPWASTAALLAARTLLRRGTLVPGRAETLAGVEEELQTLLRDPRHAPVHASARRLLGFVSFRTRPAARLAELTAALALPATDAEVRQRLIDFQLLMDKVEAGQVSSAEARAASDMADWIVTFQATSAEALAGALARWKQKQTVPWLVASLAKVPADHAAAAELLAAAARVSERSPAFATVAYHRARLLRARSQSAEARELLDGLLRRRADFTESAVNRFLHERLEVARDFDELLRFAPRIPVGAEVDGAVVEPEKRDPLFDRDAARVFNRGLPLELIGRASASEAIPAALRAPLLVSAWTRAVLLDDHATARSLAPALGKIEAAARPYLDGYLKATAEDARRFAAVYLMLHLPGLKPYVTSGPPQRDALAGIDSLRENWWCGPGLESSRTEDTPIYALMWDEARKPPAAPRAPAEPAVLLAPSQREALAQEWKRLTSLDTAPNYLASSVLAWAKAHPADPRVPEALHLVVRATRFGCTNTKTGGYSRAAFQLLHRRYAASPWARRTPYWYE